MECAGIRMAAIGCSCAVQRPGCVPESSVRAFSPQGGTLLGGRSRPTPPIPGAHESALLAVATARVRSRTNTLISCMSEGLAQRQRW